MTVSCTIAGFAGAMIPLTLKRLGADPATASSIFLTTASDVASMGMFLSLSTRAPALRHGAEPYKTRRGRPPGL